MKWTLLENIWNAYLTIDIHIVLKNLGPNVGAGLSLTGCNVFHALIGWKVGRLFCQLCPFSADFGHFLSK